MDCVRFEDVLQAHGVPHYLKVDIEAYDYLCLDALSGLSQDLPSSLSFELTPDSAARLPLLRDLGYTGFKLINQSLLLPVQSDPLPNQRQAWLVHELRRFFKTKTLPAKVAYKLFGSAVQTVVDRYRRVDGWDFPMGSSGPLGDDMAGPWGHYDETSTLIRSIFEAKAAGRTLGF